MMRKLLIYILALTLFLQIAHAQLQGEIVSPGSDVVVPVETSLSFLGITHSGQPPYTYSWNFCTSGCSPTTSNLDYVAQVNFTEIGVYTVEFEASDIVGNNIQDTVLIDVRLGRINSPENNSYFFDNVGVDFDVEGIGPYSFQYWWDFGDASVNADYSAQRIAEDPSNIVFPEGVYEVSVEVTNEDTGDVQSDMITVNVVKGVNSTIKCRAELTATGCDFGEQEAMRISHLSNAHARPITDMLFVYDYTICCEAETLTPSETTNPSNPAIFAKFTNDTKSLIGGSHMTNETTSSMFSLEGFEGVGSKCEATFIGLDGTCPQDNGCIYEFYPSEEGKSAHVAPCTDNVTENSFGEDTYAMCCQINEDCRNNLDDDFNIWFDCVDNDVCTVPGSEKPCGASDNFQHDPTCSWLTDYCDNETGECDFTGFTTPNWITTINLQTFVYLLPKSGFEKCQLTYDKASGTFWDEFCDPADPPDENDIILPPTTAEAVANVNAQYPSQPNVNEYELYAMCRLFHCSAGEDPENPLPEYVPDMQNDAYLTRHCCPMGTYWDPNILECLDFTECYDPDPVLKPCNYDYNTEFANWTGDVYNATNPVWNPQDCVLENELLLGNIEDTLCCPVWLGGENTHVYSNITYYVQS